MADRTPWLVYVPHFLYLLSVFLISAETVEWLTNDSFVSIGAFFDVSAIMLVFGKFLEVFGVVSNK